MTDRGRVVLGEQGDIGDTRSKPVGLLLRHELHLQRCAQRT